MTARPYKSEAVKLREAEHKARLARMRADIATRRIEWPKETRGPCSRCGAELTNGTINHLSFSSPRLGERQAGVMWSYYHTKVQLGHSCVPTVVAFAQAPVGAWKPEVQP
jgi:hypothetical protein